VIVALASPRIASSIDDGLENTAALIAATARQRARIVCFPEAHLPGLRGMDFEVCPFDEDKRRRVLRTVSDLARDHRIAVILGTENITSAGRQIAAVVLDPDGAVQGTQTKNQLDPSEDAHYVPGNTRQIFQVDGITFGIAICHEGFRYPETVNYALRFQESATAVIRPDGTCQAFLPYREEGVLVQTIDLEAATGKIASRYAPDRYQDPG
jgi:predicted amidohydrolase